MAHNQLRAHTIQKAQKVPCPDSNITRRTMLGTAKPIPLMVQLSDNVWRRAYSLSSGQTFVLVNGAEKIIGTHADQRIKALLRDI